MADRYNRRESSMSERSTRSGSSSNINVFSDQFAVDGGGEVADGFRPRSETPLRESTPRPTTPPRATKPLSEDSKTEAARRIDALAGSSNAARNSFTLANDSSDSPSRMPSLNQSDVSRRISTISTTSSAIPLRTQSPFIGANAPSHPYGMYPQDTQLNRTSTASTVRPSRPAHPYGMYAQGTSGEPESSDSTLGNTAGVGFPGLGPQGYARRLGPDGEGADDIIGPDGHTEQLPPYTRYPENIPPKERPISSIAEHYAESPNSSSQPTFPAGISSGATTLADNPRELPPDATFDLADGESKEKESWKEISKRKTCFGRIPVWALGLIIATVVIMAAVVGGVIGRLLPGKPKDPKPPSSALNETYGTKTNSLQGGLATIFPDAIPLEPPPEDLEPPPSGDFLYMVNELETAASCINVPQYSNAWGCAPEGLVGVDVQVNDDGSSQVTMNPPNPYFGTNYSYGAQSPIIDSPALLIPANDSSDPSMGVAYYFCTFYDKLVILPENDLSPGPSGKRVVSADYLNKRKPSYGGKLQPEDKPWFCYWNRTYVEGFIYMEQESFDKPNAIAAYLSSMSAEATPAPAPSFPSLRPRSDDDPEDHFDDDFDDDDDDYIPETQGQSGSSPAPAPAPAPASTIPSQSSTTYPVESSTIPSSNPGYANIIGDYAQRFYPKMIKIAERRDTIQGVPAYCEQMQVLDDYRHNQADPPTLIEIDEGSVAIKRSLYGNSRMKREETGESCFCEYRNH